MSENFFDLRLEDLKERSVDRLLMTDTIDIRAFEQLYEYLLQKAESLQQEFAISKQILLCLRSASAAIESRAVYIPSVRQHIQLAHDFNLLLDMLIAGDTRSDRARNVPRIV